MTASLKGGSLDLTKFIADAAANLAPNVARGALRAGAVVIAADAVERCRSEEVRKTIGVSTRLEPGGVVVAKVRTKGEGAFKAPWLEHGTDEHFISVDEERAGGRTIKRINAEVKRGSLVIGGKFVGDTVHHPGAKPFPFMRPAADSKEQAAADAVATYIGGHLTKEGLMAPPPAGESDDDG